MSDISLPEDLRELTLAELDEVAGGVSVVGSGISELFTFSATGPNASVSYEVNISTAAPTPASLM